MTSPSASTRFSREIVPVSTTRRPARRVSPCRGKDLEAEVDDLELIYRNERLERLIESSPGEDERRVTRYAYDDGGLLASEVSVFGDGESNASSVSLMRDANDRLIAVIESDQGGETWTAFGYVDDRLDSIRTVRRTGIADGNRTVEKRFVYSAFGLLEREALTTVDDDTDRVSTSTRTFEYENVPCAAPVPARP